jgi:hypothetical protein
MRLIYLAGPYSHKSEEVRQERVNRFSEALAFFSNTTENLCIYSPIVHWHEVAKLHKLRHDFSYWMQQDFHMINLSTAMWILKIDGWDKSYGLSQEIEFARDKNKEIFFVNTDDEGFYLTGVEPL